MSAIVQGPLSFQQRAHFLKESITRSDIAPREYRLWRYKYRQEKNSSNSCFLCSTGEPRINVGWLARAGRNHFCLIAVRSRCWQFTSPRNSVQVKGQTVPVYHSTTSCSVHEIFYDQFAGWLAKGPVSDGFVRYLLLLL